MHKTLIAIVVTTPLLLQACSEGEQTSSPETAVTSASTTLAPAPVIPTAASVSDDSCNDDAGVRYICGPVNVEDMLPIGDSDWIIASGMNGDLSGIGNNGAIHLLNRSDESWSVLFPGTSPQLRLDSSRFAACPGPIDTGNFSAHGLALREQAGNSGVYDVYMTSHGAREAIEVFELDNRAQKPAIAWVGCVPIAGTSWTNSVTILADGGFFATQFMDNALHTIENVTAGEITGHVFEWHPGQEVEIVAGTELAGANGILLSEDEQTLYVAAFGGHKVVRFDLGSRPVSSTEVAIDLMPDNLRWTPAGTITTGGGDWYEGCIGTNCGGSSVIEIDPASMTASRVAGADHFTDLEHASVALQIGEEYWVGSYMGKRVAIISAD